MKSVSQIWSQRPCPLINRAITFLFPDPLVDALTATPVRRRAVGLRGLVRGGIRVAVLIVVPVLEIVVVLVNV